MLKMTDFVKRRKNLMQCLEPNSIVILPAAPIAIRNHYHEFPYRQNSDFYYLTGFEEPEAIAVLIPQKKDGEFILFNRPRDKEKEIWDGHRIGQTGARKQLGADLSFPIQRFDQCLPELLEGKEKVYYPMGQDVHFDNRILNATESIRGKTRSGNQSPFVFIDIRPVLHEMRVIKSDEEISLMRQAAKISGAAHTRAMQVCKPGLKEYQLEAELTYIFQQNGARFCAYNSIVGSGKNTCILHYTQNNKTIKKGDMVLIDAGCEYQNYASDVTRSFPANGKFSAEQKAIYEIVLEAQLAAIRAIKPGVSWDKMDDICIKIIVQGLVDIGLLKGKTSDLIDKKAYLPFYMHRSGHWLGLDTHDAGCYKIEKKWRKLETNMVRTVEPGIYISSDLPEVDKRWHNIGVRIEDDIVVTHEGCEILSSNAPKTISEIEACMSA